MKKKKSKEILLNDFVIEKKTFSNLGKVFLSFKKKSFLSLNGFEKKQKVSSTLYNLIKKKKEPCFLLIAVLDYINKINEKEIVINYRFFHFELWLNQYSNLSFEENYIIRSKIIGKRIPREEYQRLFPIGMGKIYEGPHFVTAHISPDLDTTVASFWGWVDAFGARVSKGNHYWNLPEGPPSTQIEIELIFNQIFGKKIFSNLAKTKKTLALTGIDIMTQENFIKKHNDDVFSDINSYKKDAITIVDDKGYYLGDWRSYDIDGIRQIIVLLNSCLQWFENYLHVNWISLFSKKNFYLKDLKSFIEKIFLMKLEECDPVREYSDIEKNYLSDYLSKVLKISKGIKASFEEVIKTLFKDDNFDFYSKDSKKLFDKKGKLIENRTFIFSYLKSVVTRLHQSFQLIKKNVERTDIALKIKSLVFNEPLSFVTTSADVEEIQSKMSSYHYLTVNYPDKKKYIPAGVIRAYDLQQNSLGSVSLRDFCNEEEIKLPSYLQIISVIDHHKAFLKTHTPPSAVISDAQASCCLVAEQACLMNDDFSSMNMNKKMIDQQISIEQKKKSEESFIKLQNLLRKKTVINRKDNYFVHPQREFLEYLHFLYGILDDTDLLMKVSDRDVICISTLLNRMKSLQLGKEEIIISLKDIERGKDFAKKAALKILQNKDMYSLYNHVYQHKEKAIGDNIMQCVTKGSFVLFDDTKVQNGCCRITQTKMFASNVSYFYRHIQKIRKIWISQIEKISKDYNDIDLFIYMMSTLRGAEELFTKKYVKYSHNDELWIWIPEGEEMAKEHLKSFLTLFQKCPQIIDQPIEVEYIGNRWEEWQQIFQESFIPMPFKVTLKKEKDSLVVLKYPAGLINSRKAMISPYLPNLVI